LDAANAIEARNVRLEHARIFVAVGAGPCAGAEVVQSLSWYRNRLLSMPPGEIAWRVSNLVRDKVDRVLLGRRQKSLATFNRGDSAPASRERQTAGASPLIPNATPDSEFVSAWRDRAVADAEEILRRNIRLLGADRTDVGNPIRWNHEHNKNAPTPTGFAGDIDYRDYDETGDCKWVWELNRHHHLVTLGRAYRLTNDGRYARDVVDQILSWIEACPFGTGMNWRSPLELAIRLINWTFALEMIEPADVMKDAERGLIEASVYQHLWDVSRKYSRYSSANNHLIGEAAGVYVAARHFRRLPNALAWSDEAKRILCDEIVHQVDNDGVHRELATGYHLFVLQFFMIAAAVGGTSDDAFPADYTDRLLAMCDFLSSLSAAGPAPSFNDCDDGYVLDLGGPRGDGRAWIQAAEALRESGRTGESACSSVRGDDGETAFWLFGTGPQHGDKAGDQALESKRFDEAGIFLLQSGCAGNPGAISATVDAGPLGFKSIAAHGHADALSLTLRAFGVEFLIDPGTYDYFTYAEWRDYFRRTRAHNTIEIDGLDQSEMLGKFLWGRRANATCVEWTTSANGARLVAEHDGYQRLADPVTHRRTVELHAASGVLQIEDELTAAASHKGALFFHFAPECRVEQIGERRIRATRPEGAIELSLPDHTNVTIYRGSESPILGWCSRAYHEKQPISTIRADFGIEGGTSLKTTVQICGA